MSADRALQGVTVLDLGQIYNGPYCALLMAYLGARVIKIEPPGGEHIRNRLSSLGAGFTYPFILLNSSKESLTLNLKSERGKDLFKALVARADVVLENFSVGTLDRLGLGYATLRTLNPRLIYASGSGYGSFGPYRDYPAMDLTVQAMSGVMAITGHPGGPPVKAGPAVADFSGGTHLLAGILAALYQRERTGEGQRVEVAMHDAIVPTLASNLAVYLEKGVVPPQTGNRHGGLSICPYNVYTASDGYVAIFCLNEAHWVSLCDTMARPELIGDPRYARNAPRVARMDEVDQLVAAWTSTRSRAEIVDLLIARQVPTAPVKTLDEVAHDEHLRQHEMLIDVDHPIVGPVTVFGNPIKLPESPPPEIRPTPALGEHTAAILTELLGLGSRDVERLRTEGVV